MILDEFWGSWRMIDTILKTHPTNVVLPFLNIYSTEHVKNFLINVMERVSESVVSISRENIKFLFGM